MNSSQQLLVSQQFDRQGSSINPNRSQNITVQTVIEQPDQANNNRVRDITRSRMNGDQHRSDSSEKTTDQDPLLGKSKDEATSEMKLKQRTSKITFIQALSLTWFVEYLGEFQFFIYFFMGEFYQNNSSKNYIGWMVTFIITTSLYLFTYALTYYIVKNGYLPFLNKQLEVQDKPYYITFLIIYIFQIIFKIFMNISLIMMICTLYNDPELIIVIFYVGYKITFILTMVGIIIYTFLAEFYNLAENSRYQILQKHPWLAFDIFQIIPFSVSIAVGFSVLKSTAYFKFLIPQMIIQFLLITILHQKLKNFPVNVSQDQQNQQDSIPLKIMEFSLLLYSPWNFNFLQ